MTRPLKSYINQNEIPWQDLSSKDKKTLIDLYVDKNLGASPSEDQSQQTSQNHTRTNSNYSQESAYFAAQIRKTLIEEQKA